MHPKPPPAAWPRRPLQFSCADAQHHCPVITCTPRNQCLTGLQPCCCTACTHESRQHDAHRAHQFGVARVASGRTWAVPVIGKRVCDQRRKPLCQSRAGDRHWSPHSEFRRRTDSFQCYSQAVAASDIAGSVIRGRRCNDGSSIVQAAVSFAFLSIWQISPVAVATSQENLSGCFWKLERGGVELAIHALVSCVAATIPTEFASVANNREPSTGRGRVKVSVYCVCPPPCS